MTVGEAIDRYISEKSKVLSPYTIKGYNTIRKNYFKSLMDMNLTDLEQRDIQSAIMQEQAAGRSPKTIKNAHGLLTATLQAYRPKFHTESKLPKAVKTERDIFTEEEYTDRVDTYMEILYNRSGHENGHDEEKK